jgi:hypothetical protein
MQAQHEPKSLTIKINTSSKVGDTWTESVSTIGGKKTRNWAREVRKQLFRKLNHPDISVVKKVEVKVCQF